MTGEFTKNTVVTFLTRVSQLILGIGTSIIIARVLGPQGKGIYSLAILLSGFLIIFTNLGIGQASIFFIGRKKYSLKEIFGNIIIFSCLISAFAILIGLIIIFLYGNKFFPGVAKGYLFLALSLIPFQVFLTSVVNVLLGLQEINKYNFIQLTQTFVFLFLVGVCLLGFHFGIKATITAEVLSLLVGCIILFFLTKKETNGLNLSLNKSLFKDSFSYGAKIYLGNIFGFLHYRIDAFLINILLNPIAVGFYSISTVLAEKIWLISQSAGTVLFPKVSSETDEKKMKEFTPLVCRNVLFVTIITAILLMAVGRWLIISLYSKQFSDSVLPFRILLIGTVTINGWRILANDLYGRGKAMVNTYILVGVVILNIILNVIWIPKFGIVGAAWASAISYTVALIITAVAYSKISGNKIRNIIYIKKSDFRFYRNLSSTLSGNLRSLFTRIH